MSFSPQELEGRYVRAGETVLYSSAPPSNTRSKNDARIDVLNNAGVAFVISNSWRLIPRAHLEFTKRLITTIGYIQTRIANDPVEYK